MMSQYEREVVTKDQIGLQQNWCRYMKKLSRHRIQCKERQSGRDIKLWSRHKHLETRKSCRDEDQRG